MKNETKNLVNEIAKRTTETGNGIFRRFKIVSYAGDVRVENFDDVYVNKAGNVVVHSQPGFSRTIDARDITAIVNL